MLAHTPRTLFMNSLLDQVSRSMGFFVFPCSEDGSSRLGTTLGNERIAQAVLDLVHLRPLVRPCRRRRRAIARWERHLEPSERRTGLYRVRVCW